MESLRKGVIKALSNRAPPTILLVGETGVGKSSVLEFIANVLTGNDIDHYNFNILDHTNERGGSDNQSWTTSGPHLRTYEQERQDGEYRRCWTSWLLHNVIPKVHLLDTPGFANTRGIQQDELHKSIATQIKKHIDSLTAIIVLVNETVPGVTIGTYNVLSTLSTILPNGL